MATGILVTHAGTSYNATTPGTTSFNSNNKLGPNAIIVLKCYRHCMSISFSRKDEHTHDISVFSFTYKRMNDFF